MKIIRNVRRSFRDHLIRIFNDYAALGTPYTIYGETEVRDKDFNGQRPFLVILDARVLFETRHLPLIVIEMDAMVDGLELGRDSLRFAVELHIFGRNRGERDDIAAAIIEYQDLDIIIYDYSGDTPVPIGVTQIDQPWDMTYIDVSTDLAVEGSLANWTMMTASFPLIDAPIPVM